MSIQSNCISNYALMKSKKGERNGTTLTKKGWKSVLSNFNEKTGKDYENKQLTNKWYNLRREWQEWYKLFAKETLVGQDSAKNAVDAPDEWWEKKTTGMKF